MHIEIPCPQWAAPFSKWSANHAHILLCNSGLLLSLKLIGKLVYPNIPYVKRNTWRAGLRAIELEDSFSDIMEAKLENSANPP